MQSSADTIAAVATPPGRGGVGIIRISGKQAPHLAEQICGKLPEPRKALFCHFRDAQGDSLDQGLALYFPAPNSFTGEPVLELQGHGGPVLLDMLLNRCLQLGARVARPGEFSERAFINDKLDLAQAEAIADLIDAETQAAARLANRSLQGVFSERIHQLVDALTHLRMYVEAAIDFPEEEIDFLGDGKISAELNSIQAQLDQVQASATTGRLLRDGMNLVIAGRPNAGKSSLLNALAGVEAAIVTDIPGTTRDVLRERIQLDGMPLHLIDTAGLREATDQVEQEGVRRAQLEISKADLVLWVYDGNADPGHQDFDRSLIPSGVPITFVRNKLDASGGQPYVQQTGQGTEVAMSAKTGLGLELLKQHLKQVMGYQGAENAEFIARRRHLDALDRAAVHLRTGRLRLEHDKAGELLAEELRLAQQALSEITGEFSADDLLGKIFSEFCIGK